MICTKYHLVNFRHNSSTQTMTQGSIWGFKMIPTRNTYGVKFQNKNNSAYYQALSSIFVGSNDVKTNF